ncbi:hypothetical protein HDU93_005254 [Gonapodya sp. JEL0774]|nr:hypothetical protein HDU93_005254 [Gonapodya sp. JEL0774]
MSSSNVIAPLLPTFPFNARTVIGARVRVGDNFATIRYVGPVPANSKSLWYGLEWDDPIRGKHDGSHEGIRYFSTHSKHPTAASFVKVGGTVAVDFGRGFLEALLEKYAVGITDAAAIQLSSTYPTVSSLAERVERPSSLDVEESGAIAPKELPGSWKGNLSSSSQSASAMLLPLSQHTGPDTVRPTLSLSTDKSLPLWLRGVGSWGGKDVELVGWSKVEHQLSNIQLLTDVGLAGARIAGLYHSDALMQPLVKVGTSAPYDMGDLSASGETSTSQDAASCGNGNVGDSDDSSNLLLRLAPNVRELDLSRNLLSSWHSVAAIAAQLRGLELLRLAGNRLEPLYTRDIDISASTETKSLCKSFPRLATLEIGNNAIKTWSQVFAIGDIMPALKELYLGFNELETPGLHWEGGDDGATTDDNGESHKRTPHHSSDVHRIQHSPASPSFSSLILASLPHLRHLNIEHNCLSRFPWSLAHHPTLEVLAVQRNKIEGLEWPKNEPETALLFPALKSLNISDNELKEWTDLTPLARFTNLVDLRIRRNPFLVSPPFMPAHVPMAQANQASSTASQDDQRALVLARIGTVKILNGSIVGEVERRDAERWYLAKCGLELAGCLAETVVGTEPLSGAAKGWTGDLPTSEDQVPPDSASRAAWHAFLFRHSRYPSLCGLHGPPAATPSSQNSIASGGSLKGRMVTLKILREGKDIVERKVVPTMTVRTIRQVVGKAVLGVGDRSKKGWAVLVRAPQELQSDGEWVEIEDELRELRFYGVGDGWESNLVSPLSVVVNGIEFKKIKADFERKSSNNSDPRVITKEQFKDTIASHLTAFPTYAQRVFLERLFDAFDEDGSQSIDLMEFMEGLAVFLKGTTEEKLELSFKLYDINKDGEITRTELTGTLVNMLSSMYPDEDPTVKVNEMVGRLFDDLDIDGNGQLSLDEFKLSGLKEPLIVDFLDQFLEPREDQIETVGEMGPLVVPEVSIEQRTRSSRSVISLDGSNLIKTVTASTTPRLHSRGDVSVVDAPGKWGGGRATDSKPTQAGNNADVSGDQ